MYTRAAYKLARELRARQTKSEEVLWLQLRNRKLHGYKFYRQHVIRYNAGRLGVRFFIADFYCAALGLVIELDGRIHDKNKDYDQYRDEILQSRGIVTLRIKNEELYDINEVLEKITGFIK
ncbi:MAG: endonuclease domain-containing protein [Bacteroidales bacterium]|nr:endonuclease domain-containing protein [Bacteroidales bacterium]